MSRRPKRAIGPLIAATVVVGCRSPYAEKAPEGASSSSEGATLPGIDADTATSSGVGTTSSSGGDEGGPGTTTFEPKADLGWTLPEGCGDGIVEPGRFDCFEPVIVPDLGGNVSWSRILDLDGDRVGEVLIGGAQGITPVWVEPDGELRIGESVGSTSTNAFSFDFDHDGDGLRDLMWSSGSKSASVYENLGTGGLAPLEGQSFPGGFSYGVVVPVDPDEDGVIDYLVPTPWPDEPLALTLRRRQGDRWMTVGPPLELPGCEIPTNFAHADYDHDGDLDVAILESGHGCDPYPYEYDPEWHRITVLLSDPATGLMVHGGTFPIGGAVAESQWMWPLDSDLDGNSDLLVRVDGGQNLALLRGREDGTFEDGVLLSTAPFRETLFFVGAGDLDGDGTPEAVLSTSDDVGSTYKVINLAFDADSLVDLPMLFRDASAIGDINGDGIADIAARHPNESRHALLMLSVP